ncbi:MAG: ATP-grasp domain-containing protein [Pseudolysinimonas sp.]|uniref:ATP-grasp domain-containing protein n=1 Tax=Pseudolysinimonas sp. TaxID=2680009 RepID=UPI003263F5E4
MERTKTRVAVTGVGGGVGQSIIKALQGTEYEVVALDGEILATGLYSAQTARLIPYATAPDYVEELIRICQDEGCTVLFPGLDAELEILSRSRDRFAAEGITVVVSRPEVVALSNDKQLTYTELTALGALVPRTVDLSATPFDEVDLDYPMVLKERVGGSRSLNLYIVRDRHEVDSLSFRGVDLTAYIAQEYIEGDEYTCGSVTLDGTCRGVIVMRRILRDGDTYKCFTVRDVSIEAEVGRLVQALGPFGACNVQLRVRDGLIYVFEINARCSGTTGARALSGFNEPKAILDFLVSGVDPVFEVTEQTVLRYWKELVVENTLIEELRSSGRLRRPAPTPL